MAYGKRYSRYNRKNRRGNRTLSTRRIFNNKGAKAQAKQIYALRRSINSVRKQCAPEVKIFNSNREITKATATQEANISQLYFKWAIPEIQQGTADNQRIGDKIRLLPITWFINGLYRKVTHTSSGIPMYNTINSEGCALRVVIMQSRIPLNSTPSIANIFDGFETSTSPALSMSNINCPFVKGVTAQYKILANKVFYFNDEKPISNLRLKIAPAIKSLRWEEGYNLPRGYIWAFFIFGGLQSTGTNLNESDYNMVELNHWCKIPFTDA